MVTLQIEHAITEFDTWKPAFDKFADMRRDSGVQGHRVYQLSDDPCYVVVELDFSTRDEAAKLLDNLTNRVWSTPANAPALIGTPKTRFLDMVEQS